MPFLKKECIAGAPQHITAGKRFALVSCANYTSKNINCQLIILNFFIKIHKFIKILALPDARTVQFY